MKQPSGNNIIRITLAFIAIVLVWAGANQYWGDSRWNKILKDDGTGYYAYLPAVFIYHDLSFGFFDSVAADKSRPNFAYDYRVKFETGTTDKYYCGTALAQLPFFAIAHWVTLAAGYPADGYSAYYLIFVQVAAIFYALAGLFLMVFILKDFQIDDKLIALILLASVFGTNLYHYVANEPSMSHAYSFAFVNLFVFSVLRFFRKPSNRYLFISSIALGMIFLIRPVNILIVASLPFLAGSNENLKKGYDYLKVHFLQLLMAVVLFFIVAGVQFVIYKIQTGSFWVYSYGKEGFNFFHPHIISFLFSYRKGYFVYTPIAFLALFGFWFLFKESRYRFYSLLIFLLLVVYVLSSWWMWFYGGSFSQRVMIEYWIFFAILLALLLKKGKYRKWLTSFVVVLIIVCQIQTYQYRTGYIHWSDMNKERYWDNFLRIDKVLRREEKEW